MANQTLTTGTPAAPVNFDAASLSGLLNGETISVTGGALRIDSDVRWGQNAAVLGVITISASSGGSVLVDGRDVWWAPFSAATGSVPALGTAGTPDVTRGGTAVAEFLGVWTALGTAPLAAGAAMPGSGFLKFRRKAVDFSASDVLTFAGGATATLSGAGQRGWIHIVGSEGANVAASRLGSFKMLGDWFELGTTNGADDQAFQYPVADQCPAMQVETAPGSGVYEWWLNAGDRWGSATAFIATDLRAKLFGCDAAGLITIARRASNACGFKPASGCKVRVPNILVSSSTPANWAANTINTTAFSTRYDFSVANADVEIRNICGNWHLAMDGCYALTIQNCALGERMTASAAIVAPLIDNNAIGSVSGFATTSSSIVISGMTQGCTVSNNAALMRVHVATPYNFPDCPGIVISGNRFCSFGASGSAARDVVRPTLNLLRCDNADVSGNTLIGVQINANSFGAKIRDTVYCDNYLGDSSVGGTGMYVILVANRDVTVDGLSLLGGLAVEPLLGLIYYDAVSNFTVQNIGSAAAPLDLGGRCAYIVTSGTAMSVGLAFRRLFSQNTQTGAVRADRSNHYDVILDNVWGDGADAITPQFQNARARGCRFTQTQIANNTGSGLAAANIYGLHVFDSFNSATAGQIGFYFHEPTVDTAGQVTLSGAAAFTGAGTCALPTTADSVTLEMDYFALGITGLANAAPLLNQNAGSFTVDFQYDLGAGWNGTWLAATGANLSGVGAIDPATGIKLRIRVTPAANGSTNAIRTVGILTVTDATAQQQLYALPGIVASFTLTGLQAGTEVHLYRAADDVELAGVEATPGSTFTYSYSWTADVPVYVTIIKPGFRWIRINGLTLGSVAQTIPIFQQQDLVYANPA